MDFGRKPEEKRSVRPKRRWVDNRINRYSNVMFEKVVLKEHFYNFSCIWF